MKITLLKYGLLASTVVSTTITGLHYGSHAFIDVENYLVEKAGKTKLAKYVDLVSNYNELPTESDLNKWIDSAANEYKIPRVLLHSIADIESNKNPSALSKASAIGIMQVWYKNASRCNTKINKLWDEQTNIYCGAKILSENLKEADNNVADAVCMYNSGRKCTDKSPQETKIYLSRFLSKLAQNLLKFG